ncbi:MAG: glycosyltransferase family 2 protein [Spartobacteria bacterium]|nr:glycosyltransferase family 2 protein [Spartobacteria bacterium]
MPDIDIIIVSYNVCALLRSCLQSIMSQRGCSYRIFVVDNQSEDGSAAMVAEEFRSVELDCTGENLGFGRANNRALERVTAPLVYFLNPDTVLPPDALAGITSYMQAHPDVGMASTGLVFPDNSPQPAAKHRHDGQKYLLKGELSGLPGEIAWVLGASMIGRSDLIKDIGGFDARFFMYGEDEDLCLSVRKKGYGIALIPDVVVTHYQGQSERATARLELERKKLVSSNIFYLKHYSGASIDRICRVEMRKARRILFQSRLLRLFAKQNTARVMKEEKAQLYLDNFRRLKGSLSSISDQLAGAQ